MGTSEQPAEPTVVNAVAVESNEAAEPAAAVPLVEPDPVYRRSFVGRDAELGQLHGAFGKALAGHGSLAMAVSEPRIGKTPVTQLPQTYAILEAFCGDGLVASAGIGRRLAAGRSPNR